MRNPNRSVKMIPGLKTAGHRARLAFDQLLSEHPEVTQIADYFGTQDYMGPPLELTQRYRELLREAFGVRAELTPVHDEGVASTLQATLIHSWLASARDPEISLKRWIRDGVPLGINREIDTNTIFPPNTRQKETWAATRIDEVLERGLANYSSVQENYDDAKVEFSRLSRENS